MSGDESVRRVLLVWCPDWPVVAASADHDVPEKSPVAVLGHNAVVACNGPARAAGVRRGMRRRDAQARCPELVLLTDSPDRDARVFEPVLAAVEELRPGVTPLRPGLLAVRAPGRFYGGEASAGAVIAERLVGHGVWDCRIGVADDLFTAEQAARLAAPQDSVVVPTGGSARFLRELPVGVLDDADVVSLLRRLGMHTLGDFAALPARDVLARLGAYGARVHRLARGDDATPLAARTPPLEWACEVAFEPPATSVETIGFSVRQIAERLVDHLAGHGLVCTQVRVDAVCDGRIASTRSWAHAHWFSAADLVDRMRWQLQGQLAGGHAGPGLSAPVERVEFVPETVEPVADHARGLWGGADDRVERVVARLQSMLGHEAVTRPVLQGGRAPTDRQALVPWGELPGGQRPVDQPWPGNLSSPAPARMFATPRPAEVVDAEGRHVWVDDLDVVSSVPTRFHLAVGQRRLAVAGRGEGGVHDRWQQVAAWAGPWAVEEVWWEGAIRQVFRFQFVGADGRAWLLSCAPDGWWVEAGYD